MGKSFFFFFPWTSLYIYFAVFFFLNAVAAQLKLVGMALNRVLQQKKELFLYLISHWWVCPSGSRFQFTTKQGYRRIFTLVTFFAVAWGHSHE